jgi:hypothetical protein
VFDPGEHTVIAVVSEAGESIDVFRSSAGKHNTDRGDELASDPAPLEHDVHKGTPRSAIPIVERVNRLELCMRQRRLHEGRQQIGVERLTQITQQWRHELGRRWYEVRATRGIVVAADPVLRITKASRDVLVRRTLEKAAVDGTNPIFVEVRALRGAVYG